MHINVAGPLMAVEWNTVLTVVGTAIVVLGTTLLTLRTNVAAHWKGSAEALEKHLEIALSEKAALETQLLEQRQLKHDALTEAAALRAKTDLEPILRVLADVQKRQGERVQKESENDKQLATTLDMMNATLQELSLGMRRLLDKL